MTVQVWFQLRAVSSLGEPSGWLSWDHDHQPPRPFRWDTAHEAQVALDSFKAANDDALSLETVSGITPADRWNLAPGWSGRVVMMTQDNPREEPIERQGLEAGGGIYLSPGARAEADQNAMVDDAWPSPFSFNDRTVDQEGVARATRELLIAIGMDPDAAQVRDTPARVARWWAEFIDYDAGDLATSFSSVQVDQLVVVTGVRVWSLCEHHLLPFHADLAMAYLTTDDDGQGGKLLGLSKLGRIAHQAAHQLQMQERLVDEVANGMRAQLGHSNVAVLASGEHLCMTMRGIQTPHTMHTSALYGSFRDDPATRAELYERTR